MARELLLFSSSIEYMPDHQGAKWLPLCIFSIHPELFLSNGIKLVPVSHQLRSQVITINFFLCRQTFNTIIFKGYTILQFPFSWNWTRMNEWINCVHSNYHRPNTWHVLLTDKNLKLREKTPRNASNHGKRKESGQQSLPTNAKWRGAWYKRTVWGHWKSSTTEMGQAAEKQQWHFEQQPIHRKQQSGSLTWGDQKSTIATNKLPHHHTTYCRWSSRIDAFRKTGHCVEVWLE